ncbi:MAG: cysteine--tRNA ligase, partial [Chloroflexi bacterium]|nr:cysteine--tRNA ligase [Chloroflexota bacterium]
RGYRVRHVQNFTDVDDKIIEHARRQGIPPAEMAARYIGRYFEDMDALNVRRADSYPRATEEVPKILEIVQGLIAKGHAYAAGGDVYFRVRSFPAYGELSKRTLEGMRAGARVAKGEGKADPLDFVLWKAAKPGEPQWESPWGPGRPGWHIECSAMALHHLGPSLDIHGGGQDLIFPHHENEIAQAEAFTGVSPFARLWLHHGLLQIGEEKMSKSLGNLVGIQEVVSRYGSDAFRLFVLSSHYRRPLLWSEESLSGMRRGAARLQRAAKGDLSGGGPVLDPAPFTQRFYEAMDDDLNTPQALAALFDLAREINRGAEEGTHAVQTARQALRETGEVLGLTFEEVGGDRKEVGPFVQLLIETRSELRAQKQYAAADRLRDRLTKLGVILEDTPRGTVWHFAEPEER